MTQMDLVRAINTLEAQSGNNKRTSKQNLTNYLNGQHNWEYEFTRKVEVALNIKDNLLINMLPKPKSKFEKDKYNEVMKKWKVS